MLKGSAAFPAAIWRAIIGANLLPPVTVMTPSLIATDWCLACWEARIWPL
jgi:hypothetical protein